MTATSSSAKATRPKPGTLLETKDLPGQMWPEHASAAYRVFYQGIGYDGNGRLLTGSVFIPDAAPPEDGWPVVSYAHGTTGLGDSTAPSRAGFTAPERTHIAGWLQAGYAVAATDYEGLATPGPHPYFNGEAVADDVIDIVRATHQLQHPTGRRWAVAGFSQGGHAAFFTALVATGYAPDLDFRGAVMLGPPAYLRDLIAAGTRNDEDPLSPLVPVLLAGLRVSNPGFDPKDFLTDEGDRLIDVAEDASMLDMLRATIVLRNNDVGATGLTEHPEVGNLLSACHMPVTRLDRPLFLGAGADDEAVAQEFLDRFAGELQSSGSTIQYRVYENSNHVGVLAAALTDAIGWVGEQMRTPIPPQRDPTVKAVQTARGAQTGAAQTDRAAPASRFDLLDATGDGFLQGDDYDAFALRVAQAFGHAAGSEQAKAVRHGYRCLWEAISAADTDGDGQVGPAEFLDWMHTHAHDSALAGKIEPLARAVIGLVDTDANGVLDLDEFTALLVACGLTADEAGSVFSAMDIDTNGTVSVDEIVSVVLGFVRGEDVPGYWLFGRF